MSSTSSAAGVVWQLVRCASRKILDAKTEQPQARKVAAGTEQHQSDQARYPEVPGDVQPPALVAHRSPQHRGHDDERQRKIAGERQPPRLRLIDAVRPKLVIEQAGVEASAQADRKRKAGVLKRPDQDEIHELRGYEGDDGDFHRRTDILACIETGRQYFHQNQA